MAQLLDGPDAGKSGLIPMNFVEKLGDEEAADVRKKFGDGMPADKIGTVPLVPPLYRRLNPQFLFYME